MPRGHVLDLGKVGAGDPAFLGANDVAFVVIRGRSGVSRLLGPPAEVFGRPEVRLKELRLRVTDYLGHACLHCAGPIEQPADMVVCLRSMAVVAVVHETCFKRWFVLQDKASFGAYRFVGLQDRTLVPGDGGPRLAVEGVPGTSEELEFAGLHDVGYGELAEGGLSAEAGYLKARGAASTAAAAAGKDPARRGADDLNLLLCPRCDFPNKVPFLDTTARPHQCQRCGGKFAVRITPL